MPLSAAQIANWKLMQKIIKKSLGFVEFEVLSGATYKEAVASAYASLDKTKKSNLASFKDFLSDLHLRVEGKDVVGIAISFADKPLLGKLLGADENNLILPSSGFKFENGKVLNRQGEETKALTLKRFIDVIDYNSGTTDGSELQDFIYRFGTLGDRKPIPVRPAGTATDAKTTPPAPASEPKDKTTTKEEFSTDAQKNFQRLRGLFENKGGLGSEIIKPYLHHKQMMREPESGSSSPSTTPGSSPAASPKGGKPSGGAKS